MRRVLSIVVTLGVLLTVASAAHAQNMQAWAGTWKLNVAKSKYNPGPPPPSPPTANTTVLDIVNGVMRITSDVVDAQGQKSHVVRMAILDNKPHGGEGSSTQWAYRWVDANHYEWTTYVNGKATTTTKLELSRDGRTQTLTTTGTNAQGQTVNNITIFEKQ